ncbi:MAG: TolC family outer membrane protein [Alphaproteobacteria bacterium]|nr:TolC family outer membrane protein [Alphaproteobacteria bacterium]
MKPRYAGLLTAALFLIGAPVRAETLGEAFVKAYQTSPRLQAAQAELRAVDEQVAQALGGYRPTIDGSASVARTSQTRAPGNGGDVRQPRSVGIELSQPLFRGFRTSSGVSAAEQQVLAARATLQGAEQSLLLDTATAYMNVYRDLAVFNLSKNNEEVLRRQLEATQDRFEVGEVTRTDVSQAESRLARATSDRIQAEGNLKISQSNYLRLVGNEPRNISRPQVELATPQTLPEATEMAQYNNPSVVAAEHGIDQAKELVTQAEGSLLPEISLVGSAQRDWDASFTGPHEADSLTIGARATIPLYRAGTDYSRIRAAKQTAGQRQLEYDEAVRLARETAISAWQALVTGRAAIESRQAQVKAAELALDGVKQEAAVGTRTVLDTLDAEQELLDARVQLVGAERDMVVAVYQVKAAVGRLTAKALDLPVAIYDPTAYYEENSGKWIGVGD